MTTLAAVGMEPSVTVIDAARILNPLDGNILERHSIVVEGDRIKAIQPTSAVAAPPGSTRIGAKTLTLLPGLIDTHTHLLYEHDLRLGFGNQHFFDQIAQRGTTKRALFGVKTARELLRAGFTSVRDLGNSGMNGDVALRDAIEAGWVTGPRIMASTRAISLVGGQFDSVSPEGRALVAQEYAEVATNEEAVKAVRQAFFDGADCIKLIIDSGLRVMPVEMVKAIVDEVRRVEKMGFGQRPVAAHAISDMAIRNALEGGVDSIEHGYGISERTMRLMAERKVFLVLTEDSYDPSEIDQLNRVANFWKTGQTSRDTSESTQDWRQVQRKRIAQAFDLGVPIAFGSDAYSGIPGGSRGERTMLRLLAYADAGVANLKVLQAATSNAAKLMGRHYQVGSLAPGMLADIIGVEGDPLDDIQTLRRVRFVMKNGTTVRDRE